MKLFSPARALAALSLLSTDVVRPFTQAIVLDPNSEASIKDVSSQVAKQLVAQYATIDDKGIHVLGGYPGILYPPYYWWQAGAMFGTLLDYWHYTGDDQYNEMVREGLIHQFGEHQDLMPSNQSKNEGNDDQVFWAFSMIAAAEYKLKDPPSDQPGWLAMTQSVFNQFVGRYQKEVSDGTCGGGMRWQIYPWLNGWTYKDTASNGAVLDACLKDDPNSKVACETCTKTGMVMVFGEITTKSKVNYEAVVRNTLKKIGYDAKEKGIDYRTCNVVVALEEQSPDIAQSVVGAHQERTVEEIGAGDQGHMFGYASDETPELMPLTHSLATQIGARLTKVRVEGTLKWVRPDGKTQVVVEYKKENGAMIPIRVHTIVISTQHDEGVTNEQIRKDLMEQVIKPVVPAKYLDDNTIYHLNPSGRFVIGGPHGDAGLTGRKIIIDSYGGWGAHGGGAFSGKDSTKVDRSAAYAVRWIAKSLVAAKLARRCLVQVSYAIGVAHPLSVFVDSYGTGTKSDAELLTIVKNNFDLRPGCIIRDLQLTRPIFQKTAAYGHFGREDKDFTWEQAKQLNF